MSFDWRAFATGFLKKTQEIQEERSKEAKTFEEDQRRAAEANATQISRRRAVADRVTGYANYLQQNGFTEEQLQAVISSGPEAIRTITEQVQAEVQRNNNRPLGSADVEALINMPAGFQPTDMSLQEFINRTYNLTPVATPQEEDEEFNFMDRLFGRDQMARARQRISDAPFSEGMSIADINAAAQRADYEAVQPGTFVTFSRAYEYDITEQGVDFIRDSNRILDELRASPAYSPIKIREESETPLDMDQIVEIQRRMRIEAVDPLIMGYAEGDPVGFMEAHEAQLRISLGVDYVEQLKERLGLTAPEPEEEGQEGTDTSIIPVARPDTNLPAGEAPDVTTEVVAPVAPRADTLDLTVEPEEEVTVPDPETTVQVEEGDTYTFAQWQDMSREERRDAGLPLSEIEAQIYFNRFGAGIGDFTPIEDLVGPAGEGDPEQRRIYEELSSQGVDDVSIALLQSHGSDMLNYAMEQGATTEAELIMALTEWGQENNIVMPFDKAALIVALKSVIDNQ